MATGSGKTPTALVLAAKVAERNRPLALIVVCPFINLCKQWIREIAAFGIDALPCFEGRQRWQSQLDEGYQRLSAGLDPVQAIVTTNATFQSEPFQTRIRPRIAAGNVHHLLIADEVHNLGAANARTALPDGITLRLGLSATPERHFDPVGTAAVLDYFGPIVYQYSLSQAIADGRLCRYRYHPILVDLTDAEADEYLEITTRLARFYHGDTGNEELNQAALHLLMRRARLIGAAANKLKALRPGHRTLYQSCQPKRFFIAVTGVQRMPSAKTRSNRSRPSPGYSAKTTGCGYATSPFARRPRTGKRSCATLAAAFSTGSSRSAAWMRGSTCRSCGWGFCLPARLIPGSLCSGVGGCCAIRRASCGLRYTTSSSSRLILEAALMTMLTIWSVP